MDRWVTTALAAGVAVLCTASPTPAKSPSRSFVIVAGDDTMVLLVDKEAIRRTDFWMGIVWYGPQARGEVAVHTRQEVDCKAYTTREILSVAFDAQGAPLGIATSPQPQAQRAARGSMMETVLDYVCKHTGSSGPGVSTSFPRFAPHGGSY